MLIIRLSMVIVLIIQLSRGIGLINYLAQCENYVYYSAKKCHLLKIMLIIRLSVVIVLIIQLNRGIV